MTGQLQLLPFIGIASIVAVWTSERFTHHGLYHALIHQVTRARACVRACI